MSIVRTKDLLKNFTLTLVAGEDGIHREIITSDISRPGIEMTGYFKYYPQERLQLIGRTEMAYFLDLTDEEKRDRASRLCTDITPGIVVSRGMEIPEILINAANESGVPILHSPRKTTRVISRLTNYLEAKFAPSTAIHGVLVDIYGVGVLITGQSGVGKSETALELVKRGHRLVADDSVEIRQEDYDSLIGNPPPLIEHLLEIRGLGIINVMTLFGAGSVRSHKKISFIINLEIWDQKKQYDRLGLDEDKMKIMDVELPKATIPVRPGRNLAVIIEVAAMNFRLKRMGVNAAEEFSERLTMMIEQESEGAE
ncbi:HPr(Ser) kinase/phosphatase [Virgibacillus halodenitrificans]|jgi:HPr kinase/phosphorylase|uniref:HPr kinase/phosphorylase n=1 Tax=Virgibacillus halodenitrificans TaxID=1482 RepID=A0AAC9NL47_VIRHA|nr:HPr(Ser) kinase/phosphatase [Virgibacillus halodenitrificans]APC49117.1 HPr kinase/phosphorylase [Virgibacillus halodenitrificans]MBD1223232.1 HPr kinase/phosphorylase [Virgibacillus halodenitrificans]MCG1026869.1 HPr kinase/phosphorylase [Virgibacillus halodenitrificans]MCJ0932984.1 HPr(Ser) kinase/phosphatase [Virgibacillus halodenitrificans]MEC2160508.1 HPr(Ser) kinase/phosphatase [Virgibacillus halodenitrificans]